MPSITRMRNVQAPNTRDVSFPIRLASAFAFIAVIGSGLAVFGQLPPTPERSGSEPPKPRLFVADRTKDLGEIIEGEKVEVLWRLENHGTADLVISNTRASCGCTVAPLSQKDSVIPPGGHVEFKAHFDSRGRRGEQRQEVTVVSNDPVEPQFSLQFQAQVSSLYEVAPPGIVNLRMVRRGGYGGTCGGSASGSRSQRSGDSGH